MNLFRKVSICFFSVIILLFSNIVFANTDPEKAKEIIEIFQQQKNHFPEGSLDDVEYVKKILKQMVDADQKVRTKFFSMEEPMKYQDAMKAFADLDEFHLQKMKVILAKHGWINISKFGKEADHNAWLLVQHSDTDPLFQAGCAFILEQLVKQDETSHSNFAYLYDRVATKEAFIKLNFKQKYGTQARPTADNKDVELFPYEGTLSELDERRKKIGLPSVEEYLKSLRQMYVNKVDPSTLEKR